MEAKQSESERISPRNNQNVPGFLERTYDCGTETVQERLKNQIQKKAVDLIQKLGSDPVQKNHHHDNNNVRTYTPLNLQLQKYTKFEHNSEDETSDSELGSINCVGLISSSPSPTSDEESSSSGTGGSSEESDNAKPPLTRHQKITLLSLIISCTLDNASFSILLPFFPLAAENKDVSTYQIGFIFGIYALVQFIVSPFLGKYIPVVGAKSMFLFGLFVTGSCNLIFGMLIRLPDGMPFIVCCFTIRIIEAFGAAAGLTASYTIVAVAFPARVAQTIGILETAIGVGFMIGPAVGGILYELGGYYLPFVCLGVSVILSAIVNIFLLPSQGTPQKNSGSMWKVLNILPIWPVLIAILISSSGVGFLDPSLAPHLEQFNLRPAAIGGFFFVSSGVYAFVSPFLGYLADYKDVSRIMMILGSYISGVGFLLIGPSYLLKLPNELWIIGLGCCLLGVGWGCSIVPSFQDMLISAVWYGLPDNLETQGVIAGLYMSIYSLGYFIGPSIAGIAIGQLGFNLSVTIYAGVCFATTIGLGLFCCWENQCGIGRRKPNRKLNSDLKKDDDEVEPLLPGNEPTVNLEWTLKDLILRVKHIYDMMKRSNSKDDLRIHYCKELKEQTFELELIQPE